MIKNSTSGKLRPPPLALCTLSGSYLIASLAAVSFSGHVVLGLHPFVQSQYRSVTGLIKLSRILTLQYKISLMQVYFPYLFLLYRTLVHQTYKDSNRILIELDQPSRDGREELDNREQIYLIDTQCLASTDIFKYCIYYVRHIIYLE